MKPLPSWVKESKKDTEKSLYGVGIGKSYKEAVSLALNNAISKLQVDISSSFASNIESETFSNNEFIRSSNQSKTKMIVKTTTVNNFKVLNVLQRSNKYFILIEINKLRFQESLKLSIDNDLKRLSIKYNIYKENPLKLREEKENLYLSLNQISYNNLLLKSLSNHYNSLENIEKLRNNLDKAKVIFKIISQRNIYSDILSEVMLEQGFINGNDINVYLNSSKEVLQTLDKFTFRVKFIKNNNIIAMRVIQIKVRRGSNEQSLVKQYFRDELERYFNLSKD